jgi:hypothetical protein
MRTLCTLLILSCAMPALAADLSSLIGLRVAHFENEQPTLAQLRYSQRINEIVIETEYLYQRRLNNQGPVRQLEVGAGWRFQIENATFIPLLTVALADQSKTWAVPTVWFMYGNRWSDVTVRARYFSPLDEDATARVLIKPVRVGWKPVDWLVIGAATTITKPEGQSWDYQAGPMLGFKKGKLALYAHHYAGHETELALAVRF